MLKDYFGTIDAGEIEINPREVELRLGGSPNKGDGVYKECLKALCDAAVCRYSLVKTEVKFTSGGCNFGTFTVASNDLMKNLKGCNEAWLMGVTLGGDVDRLLTRLGIKSPAKRFITDAYASALVEAVADRVERIVCDLEKGQLRPRYSPGYGDCKIEIQKDLLEQLHAKERLGISLDEACFMRPVKSITAIIGIE